jgi:CheY-like chemotaxis protein
VDLLEAGLEPDVILLDLTMPRMDGREFLDWLRASPKHRDRRVIVASGYLDEEHPVDVDRAFSKPFRPDLLERELARLASGD